MSRTPPPREVHHGREKAGDGTSEQTKGAAMLESGGTDLAGFPAATSAVRAAAALEVARGQAHAPSCPEVITSTLGIVLIVTFSRFSIPNITVTAST